MRRAAKRYIFSSPRHENGKKLEKTREAKDEDVTAKLTTDRTTGFTMVTGEVNNIDGRIIRQQ